MALSETSKAQRTIKKDSEMVGIWREILAGTRINFNGEPVLVTDDAHRDRLIGKIERAEQRIAKAEAILASPAFTREQEQMNQPTMQTLTTDEQNPRCTIAGRAYPGVAYASGESVRVNAWDDRFGGRQFYRWISIENYRIELAAGPIDLTTYNPNDTNWVRERERHAARVAAAKAARQ